jgi:hypothetical protein
MPLPTRSLNRTNAVADQDQRFASAQAIGEPATRQLQQTRRGFGDALDQAEKRWTCSQDVREEKRQERIDHLAGEIGEQRDDAQPQNIAAENATVHDLRSTLRHSAVLREHHALAIARTAASARSTSSSRL